MDTCRTFLQEVRLFADAHRMLPAGTRVLVAISGGADSVALLRVLLAMDMPCSAVHCNFHLRGEESDRDECFVRGLCDRLDVPLIVMSFDTQAYAATHHLSIEMAAREQRYNAFHRLREELRLDVVAVAHHLEDSVETLLFNLMRGTGLKGLCGIAPVAGHIVRPLLGVQRADIEGYLQALDQPWIDDSSNATDDYARNRIRHHLLPLMQELNATALQNMAATASHLRGVSNMLAGEASEAAAITALHSVLNPYGYNETQVTNLLDALRHRRQTLLPTGLCDEAQTLTARLVPYSAATMPRTNRVCCIDIRRLQGHSLTLRRWQEGDRFCPFGMGGKSRLVSDLLTDHHLSRNERTQQQVLCMDDTIAWVVGLRTDERFRIADDCSEMLIIEQK